METTRHKITNPNGYDLNLLFEETEDGFWEEWAGDVTTHYGYVRVASQYLRDNSGKISNRTQLFFAYNGFEYSHESNKFYSSRYLVTLANRFAKQITESQKQEKPHLFRNLRR